MYQVVIVDDEPLIRRGLQNKVSWANLGFQICGEAANGVEALESVTALKPDLLLIDMNMPVMDGIGLLEKLFTLSPAVKVVVISGYSDFHYTRAAITYGVFDYVLKPIDPEELSSVLTKLRMALDSEHSKNDIILNPEILQEAIPLLKDKFLNRFVSSEKDAKNQLQSQILDLGIPLGDSSYTCLAFKIPDLPQVIKTTFQDNHEHAFTVITQCISGSFSAGKLPVAVFRHPLYPLNFFAILSYSGTVHSLSDVFKALKINMENQLGSGVIVGIGSCCPDLNEVNLSFEKALEALNYCTIINDDCIIFSDDIQQKDLAPIVYSSEKEKAFLTSLEIGNREEMEYNIQQLFHDIREQKAVSFRQVYKLCSELLFLCDRVLRNSGCTLEQIFVADITAIDYIACKGSLVQLQKWFTQVMLRIMQVILDKKATNLGNIVVEIQTYLETHYFEEVTLTDMAHRFHLNKSYLSALFKKRTGQNFVDYITAIRMSKARELLSDQKLKVREVAKRVGYQDEKYFSKLFKKYQGVTPDTFRKDRNKSLFGF